MASVKINGQFQSAIKDLVLALLKDSNKVGLVMRWDENDKFLWTFWSEANKQTKVPGGGACHAEEVMIVSWDECLKAAGIESPKVVEVFLSQSPCADRSPHRNFGGTFWPEGCSNKLSVLAKSKDVVNEWRIAFFRYYQEENRIDAQAYGPIAVLCEIDNVDIYWYKERHDSI